MTRGSKNKHGAFASSFSLGEPSNRQIFDLTGSDSDDKLIFSPSTRVPNRKRGRPRKIAPDPPTKSQKKVKAKTCQVVKAPAPEVLKLRQLTEEILQNNGFDDATSVQRLQLQSQVTSAFLRSLDNPRDQLSKKFPSTLPVYGEYFLIYLPNNLFAFLHTADAFQGIKKKFNRERVVGLVQNRGEGVPLMYAISGRKDSVEEDPLVLENSRWTELVLDFANYNCQKLAEYWDTCHQQRPGTNYASHAEKKLMLFYAMNKVKEILKLDAEPERLRAELGDLKAELKESGREVHADVVLPRPACDDCKKFREVLEKRSGINFHFVGCKTVGEVLRVRDKNGYLKTPLYAADVDEEFDQENDGSVFEENDDDIEDSRKSTLQVVIQVGKKHPKASMSLNLDDEESRLVVQTIAGASNSQVSRNKIRGYSYKGTSKKKSPRAVMEKAWDMEYSPPGSQIYSQPGRNQFSSGYPTPPQPNALFSSEALEIGKRVKKRARDADLEGSPTPLKGRHHRHSN